MCEKVQKRSLIVTIFSWIIPFKAKKGSVTLPLCAIFLSNCPISCRHVWNWGEIPHITFLYVFHTYSSLTFIHNFFVQSLHSTGALLAYNSFSAQWTMHPSFCCLSTVGSANIRCCLSTVGSANIPCCFSTVGTANIPCCFSAVGHVFDACEPRLLWKHVQRPNPKSLTGGWSRLWHRVKVDSGTGLPAHGTCVWVDYGVDIRWGYSQLRHRVLYTMFLFGFGLWMESIEKGYLYK